MIPIRVDSNLSAVQLGANRAQNHVNNFNAGLQAAGQNFGDAVIKGRLLQNENQINEKQELQAAIALAEQTGNWSKVDGMLRDPWYRRIFDFTKSDYQKGMEAYESEIAGIPLYNQQIQQKRELGQNIIDSNVNNPLYNNASDPMDISQVFPSHIDTNNSEQMEKDFSGNKGTGLTEFSEYYLLNKANPGREEKEEWRVRNNMEQQIRNAADERYNSLPFDIDRNLLRAAEAAGINTGYMQPSKQDEIDYMADIKAQQAQLDWERQNSPMALFNKLNPNEKQALTVASNNPLQWNNQDKSVVFQFLGGDKDPLGTLAKYGSPEKLNEQQVATLEPKIRQAAKAAGADLLNFNFTGAVGNTMTGIAEAIYNSFGPSPTKAQLDFVNSMAHQFSDPVKMQNAISMQYPYFGIGSNNAQPVQTIIDTTGEGLP